MCTMFIHDNVRQYSNNKNNVNNNKYIILIIIIMTNNNHRCYGHRDTAVGATVIHSPGAATIHENLQGKT